MTNIDVINTLISEKDRIISYLQNAVDKGNFNYKTFGTEIEDYISNIVIKILSEQNFIKSLDDYHLAVDKNEFPDFTLNSTPKLALEFKSGNLCKKSSGNWTSCNNSNNDMGTLNSWPQKLEYFGGDNIYYIFVIYKFNDEVKEIIDVQVEPFYKFLDINTSGVLKYREKDGNLRPKDFYKESSITSIDKFLELFGKTIVVRSKNIIQKHLLNIPQDERLEFIESLKSII